MFIYASLYLLKLIVLIWSIWQLHQRSSRNKEYLAIALFFLVVCMSGFEFAFPFGNAWEATLTGVATKAEITQGLLSMTIFAGVVTLITLSLSLLKLSTRK